MDVDHVVVAVPELDTAVRDFEDSYGLVSVEGGVHPGWGTANRIVPLGNAYLELIAVVEPAQVDQNPLGPLLRGIPPGETRLLAWVARPDDIDEVAMRLGIEAESGSRVRPDGSEIRWRIAGMRQAVAEPCLPFFIEWSKGTELPGAAVTPTPARLEGLSLKGDAAKLASWIGPNQLTLAIEPGSPAVTSVQISTDTGRQVTLRT